jgi:hypothetical protein
MTALQYVWGGGVIIGLIWSRFDPRAAWTTATLTLPFLAYQISSFTLGHFYYGESYGPGWKPALPMVAACTAIVLLVAMGSSTQRRLRTL